MLELTITPYEDAQFPYTTSNGRLFASLDAAEAYVADWHAYCAVFEPIPRDAAGNWRIPFPMSREEYETWAGRAEIEPWSDAEIRHNAYGIEYYEPQETTRETGLQVLRLRLAGRRLAQLEWEDRQRAGATTAPAVPTEPCALCGTQTSRRMVMSSPCGPVCPDCFDQAEEAI